MTKKKVNNFIPPEQPEIPLGTYRIIGVKEGSPKREVLFETESPEEFTKAYLYHYKSGKYVAVFKEFNGKQGGI